MGDALIFRRHHWAVEELLDLLAILVMLLLWFWRLPGRVVVNLRRSRRTKRNG